MTLTQAAVLTKKGIAGSIIFILFAVLCLVAYQLIYTNLYLPHRKPVEIPPNRTFGSLPRPQLTGLNISSSGFTYTIDTTTGALPEGLPTVMNVYFVPQLGTTLLAPDNASKLANSLGFTNGPNVVNTTQYHFTDPRGGEIVIDLESANFSFNRPVDKSASYDQLLPDSDQIVSNFIGFLSDKGLMKDDLRGGRSTVLFNHTSYRDSDTAIVSIWPKDLNGFKVVTPQFKESNIRAAVTRSTDDSSRYIQMQYTYWAPDQTTFGTYGIKPITQAFQELQNGKGTVVEAPSGQNALITDAYLAYYEPETYSPYIEPIYVFSGKSFAAYVPAITDSDFQP